MNGTTIKAVLCAALCGLIFLPYPSCAQQLPQSPSISDTTLVNALIDSSFEYSYSDPKLAEEFANKALQLSRELDFRKGLAGAHREMGYALSTQGDFEGALQHFKEGLRLYRAMGDTTGIISQLNDIGSLYRGRSEYSSALEYYFESLGLCRATGFDRGAAAVLGNIGLTYFELEEHDKALEFYRQGLEMNKKTGRKASLAVSYNNIGLLHGDEGRYELSLEYHLKALELRRELGYTIELANSLNNLGRVSMQMGKYEQAVGYLREAFEVNDGNDPDLTSIIHENMAKTYRAAGRYDSALVHARQTLEKSRAFGTLLGVKVGYELLSDIHKKLENYEQAVVYQEQLMAVKDSILNEEKARQINELQAKYEAEKKEKEIALLEEEKKQQALLRNALLAGLILVGIIGVLVFNRQRLKIRKNRAELENRRLEEEKLQQDLEFRNRQLTTHTLHLVQKNTTMEKLREKIGGIRKQGRGNGEISKELQSLEQMVDYSFHLDDDWEEFRLYFEQVHPGFFDELKQQYPELTTNELRLSALARLNLSVKETAAIMGITPDSVKTARYRLRKKLDIETEENLSEFLMSITD